MSGPSPYWRLLLGAGAAALAPAPAQAQVWRFHEPHVLGASLDIAVVAADPACALAAARAARAEIARLDIVLSGWRPDSELAALNAAPRMDASPDLFAVIQAAEAWRRRTGGAFDGRLGRLIRAVGNELPDLSDLAAASVVLDAADRTIVRPQAVAFDLDGIAKGHVIDAALAAARRAAPDLTGLMIDIGGDVRVWGEAPSAAGWRVAVADPSRLQDNAEPAQTLRLTDKAVAFSGSGLRGGHILSPRDGRPVFHASAAVVADTARDADALATALCVLQPAEAVALVDRLDGYEAMVIDASGRRLPSRGWNDLIDHQAPPARLIRAQAAAPWPPGYQLTINYEIPKIPNKRSQPPYVAVWITDAAGAAVRTLLLLGNDDRFIDQNFIWWRKVGRVSGGYDAVAKPTRRPGRYSLVWDGHDDRGAALGQGRYTLHVEASREHGGFGYQTFDVVLGSVPVTASAAADDELGPATLRYGPRS